MVVEEELVRAPSSKKFDKFLVDRYLSTPGQISRSDTSVDTLLPSSSVSNV